MELNELIERPGGWLAQPQSRGIVLSSRVRLARNLRSASFPGWGGEDECVRVWGELCPVLTSLDCMPENLAVEMSALNELDKQVLYERNLISREHAEKDLGSGLVVERGEVLSIMVNEEDHLRIQGICSGLDLVGVYKRVDTLDTEIETHVEYAFSPRYGYLTACPSNVGSGMRASVMMHVPGLVLMKEINPIIKGLGKIGLAVRGLGGEGTEATGNMFQISNQVTLGESEQAMVKKLDEIVREIMSHEESARKRLLAKKEHLLMDHVGRASGILRNAHMLSSKEALDLLSGLRLGVDLGIITDITQQTIDELLLLTRPGHLQKARGTPLSAKNRDIERAALVREHILKA